MLGGIIGAVAVAAAMAVAAPASGSAVSDTGPTLVVAVRGSGHVAMIVLSARPFGRHQTDALDLWRTCEGRDDPKASRCFEHVQRRVAQVWGRCAGCRVEADRNVVVATRGLPSSVRSQVTGIAKVEERRGLAGLVARCPQFVSGWPRATPARSTHVVARGAGVVAEDLVIDYAAGQASAVCRGLVHLHAMHLGEVALPRWLERAAVARDEGRRAAMRKATTRAVAVGREALAVFPTRPRWIARHALARALLRPRDRSVLRDLDRALAKARRDPVVQRLVAEVLWLRGDAQGARRHLQRALGLRPDDREAQVLLDGVTAAAMRGR